MSGGHAANTPHPARVKGCEVKAISHDTEYGSKMS
jgi:hypothetical protein